MNYSTREEMSAIIDRTTRGDWPTPGRSWTATTIRQWQSLVREVLVAPPVQDYAIRLVLATHPQGEFAAAVTNRFLRFGSSPRSARPSCWPAKVRAMLEGRLQRQLRGRAQGLYAGDAAPHPAELRGPGGEHFVRYGAGGDSGEVKEKASDAASLPDMEKVMRRG